MNNPKSSRGTLFVLTNIEFKNGLRWFSSACAMLLCPRLFAQERWHQSPRSTWQALKTRLQPGRHRNRALFEHLLLSFSRAHSSSGHGVRFSAIQEQRKSSRPDSRRGLPPWMVFIPGQGLCDPRNGKMPKELMAKLPGCRKHCQHM